MIKNLLPPGLTLARAGGVESRPEYNMLSGVIGPWNFQEEIDVGIVGAPFSKGTYRFKGTDQAPDAIRETWLSFATRSPDFRVDIADLKIRDIGDIQMHPTDAVRCHANIQEVLYELYRQSAHFVPIILGGDHSVSAPSIQAFKDGKRFNNVGLIVFDAHNDLANPAADGLSSGTPFRLVIDQGYIDGRNAVQIGLHGSMNSGVQEKYAAEKGLREITAREVRQRGIQLMVEEAIAQAGNGTDAIYVSFDIDAIEHAMAPGTGSHAPGGLDLREAFEAVYMLGRHPKVMAMDIVEVDPLKDNIKGMTPRVACNLIVSFLAGLHERRAR